MSQQQFGKNMNRTAAAGFGHKVDQRQGNLVNDSMNASDYNNKSGVKRGATMTLDAGDDKLSNSNYSAGGSRYVVGIKNPHAFYGPGAGESG